MLSKYQLESDNFYNFNIMLNDFCNNRCTYCRQFSEYGSRELDMVKFKKIYHFIRKAVPKERRTILFEWGEPTFFSHLAEALQEVQSFEEKIVILSNGRVPSKNIPIVLKHLQENTIDYIGLHVPVANEPLKEIWGKDINMFLSLLPSTLFEKIIIIGLMHNVEISKKDILQLLQYREKYGKLIMGNSFCFPHPNIMGRHYIDYNSRLKIMEDLIKIFLYMLKMEYPIILDSTLPCILKHGIEKNNLTNKEIVQYFMDNRVSMVKNFEFHIDLDWGITLLSNIAPTSFITGYNIFNYSSFDDLRNDLNEEIATQYNTSFKNFPKQCTNCDYFLQWCTGDHFKLISNHAKS